MYTERVMMKIATDFTLSRGQRSSFSTRRSASLLRYIFKQAMSLDSSPSFHVIATGFVYFPLVATSSPSRSRTH